MRRSVATSFVGLCLVAAALAACSSDPTADSAPGTTPTSAPAPTPAPTTLPPLVPPDGAPPLPITVSSSQDERVVEAWTWCWGPDPDQCHAGDHPEIPPDIATEGEVIVEFPAGDWELTAELCFGGAAPCLDSTQVDLESVGAGRWRFEVPDPEAFWAVTLHGFSATGTTVFTFVTLPSGID